VVRLHEHPFTAGLADGTLPEAAFRHYLVQDYLFLIEFARAVRACGLQIAAAERYARGRVRLSAILDVEMNPTSSFVRAGV